ncbi:MAG TPA: TonB-dependent receptor [Steroidobacteraceae bacterium]
MTDPNRRMPPTIPAARTRLAVAVSAVLATTAQLQLAPVYAADDIEEIVVTATRRNETVSDIPYNISAVGAADIVAAGVTDLQGLTHMIPGLVSPDLGPRASNINDTLTIRGLNASSVNAESQEIAAPLVSTYVDETPLFANLKMTDIARVEVLRGPQGTLYGSGSVGGTVRMIHNEPDPTTLEFDVSTRASHTANAANPSEAVDFIGNLPISDTMALRASGGYEKLAGFTDASKVAALGPDAQPILADPADPVGSPEVFTQERGVDRSETWYARGAFLWKPSDVFKLTLSYQHQTDQSGGYSQVLPGERYDQTLYLDQPGSFQTDLGALDLSYDAGFATVSSDSSYTSQSAFSQYDLTGLIESLAAYYGNYPRILSPILDNSTDKAFTEEVRMVSKTAGPWDWVAGAYYNNRTQTLTQVEPILGFASWSQLPGTGQPPGCTTFNPVSCPYPSFGDVIQYYKGGVRPSLNPYPDLNFTLDRHVQFSDFALFNETSYHFTDKWQATAGARVFWQHYDQSLVQTLPMCGTFCSQSGTAENGLTEDSNAKGFRNQVFKFNTSYEIAPRTLVYVTWSEGFRRGGVNALPIGNCYYCETAALLTYKPDEARNTEVGIKGSFGRGSSYTFTLYNIDWKDPQIEAYTVTGGFDFVTNGNTARSRGAESELTLVLLDSTKLELGYSYTDAILTSSFQRGIVPDLIGVSGDRLPEVSKQQATAALDYSLPISGNRDFHARLDASYRSDFWTALPHSPTATDLPGFALVNARAGFGFAGSWRVDAFVNNLTNQEAATSVSTTPGPAHDRAYFVGRPRTVGLDLNYSFKDHP